MTFFRFKNIFDFAPAIRCNGQGASQGPKGTVGHAPITTATPLLRLGNET